MKIKNVQRQPGQSPTTSARAQNQPRNPFAGKTLTGKQAEKQIPQSPEPFRSNKSAAMSPAAQQSSWQQITSMPGKHPVRSPGVPVMSESERFKHVGGQKAKFYSHAVSGHPASAFNTKASSGLKVGQRINKAAMANYGGVIGKKYGR
jgi:hypothetical protein